MMKTPAVFSRTRRGLVSLFLVAFALCALAPGTWTLAQSGRRKADPARQSPAPTASAEPEGESESQPRHAVKNQSLSATFIVCEDENVFLDISFSSQRDIIGATFLDRLRQSNAVKVERGGKATRKEARDRAKKEREAYVVFLQLEEDVMTPRSRGTSQVGHADPSYLAIRLYVYAPASGDVKFTDLVTQRPYRSTTSIGGVRLPVPVARPERYPGEHQLAQAARDAADRLLARFDIPRPPNEE